ncbi:type II toxin-antitoxin system VapC family toxin [Paracraurococcus lichenis]|uniref:Type II toxin-antitoxin system VapC family toxin n=1 Tax=Paracraurococcus lichenis TaxID=3064888 RepID=A0ABT9DX15_9PROT|nr:type II toxin-antitoxin system VapC family toxin [Paracraurococcus sp. LOR1-02]MDO9708432.1 type II toxin-antitoxin system VapC family toxin [Paracraurococcus sp. LOR1-02]
MAARGVLLDTCALIWVATASPMLSPALGAIRAAAEAGEVHISLISAWEIACLARRRAARSPLFLPDPKSWFAAALRGPGIRLAPFTPEIAVDTEFLPSDPHRDPADRALIATARHLGLPLVTRDARILACAEAGHVGAVAC